jgi:hypothetical protein
LALGFACAVRACDKNEAIREVQTRVSHALSSEFGKIGLEWGWGKVNVVKEHGVTPPSRMEEARQKPT